MYRQKLFCAAAVLSMLVVKPLVLSAQPSQTELDGICAAVVDALLQKEAIDQRPMAENRTWSFTTNGTLVIEGPNGPPITMPNFSFANRADCRAKIVHEISVSSERRPPATSAPPLPKSCRILVAEAREFDVARTSIEMSGGHTQPEWCSNVVQSLRPEYPNSNFSIVSSSERTRSGCAPFNCPCTPIVA